MFCLCRALVGQDPLYRAECPMIKEAIFVTSSDGYSVLDIGYSVFFLCRQQLNTGDLQCRTPVNGQAKPIDELLAPWRGGAALELV